MPSLEQNYSHPRNFFSACHFLIGFDKCERLHGHNYTVIANLTYSKENLTSTIDFRIINAAIKQELSKLNQKILLPNDSSKIHIQSSKAGNNWEIVVNGNKSYSFPKKDTVILDGIKQTTIESLAFYLHQKLCSWLKKYHPGIINILDITVAENLGNRVTYSDHVLEDKGKT